MILVPGAGCAVHHPASGERWEYDRLAGEVARRAGMLARHGVGRGDRVLLVQDGSPAFFADLYAVWRRGAVAACASPGLSAPEIEALNAMISPRAILRAHADVPVDGALVVDTGSGETREEPPVEVQGGDTALILFTSGTTGQPKGVVHTFGSLASRVTRNRAFIGDEVLGRALCVLPVHFGHGLIGNCLTPLAAGGRLVLTAGGGVRVAARLAALVDEEQVSFMSSVPAFWRLVLRMCPPPERGHLRRIHVGSAPLSADLWQEIIDWSGGAKVVNMYGLTETANWVAGASSASHAPEDGLVGELWGGEARVLDAEGVLHGAGEGEICLRSASVMAGYFERADLTEAAFHGDWFRTGDIGRIGADGVMRLSGRVRTEINRAGIKVHPEEVELVLERHPGVAEACAFPVPDPAAGEIVGAAVVAPEGGSIELAELTAWCAARMRHEACPDRWFILPGIPRNDRGKSDRLKVKTICLKETRPHELATRNHSRP